MKTFDQSIPGGSLGGKYGYITRRKKCVCNRDGGNPEASGQFRPGVCYTRREYP